MAKVLNGKRAAQESTRYVRTNVVLDADLMERAFEYSTAKTRKGLIDEALRLYVRMHAQWAIRELRGKVEWVGELDDSRDENRWPEEDSEVNDEKSLHVAAPAAG